MSNRESLRKKEAKEEGGKRDKPEGEKGRWAGELGGYVSEKGRNKRNQFVITITSFNCQFLDGDFISDNSLVDVCKICKSSLAMSDTVESCTTKVA